MKIIFFGSSEFAVPILEALKDKEEVILVVTQPDRKKGRLQKLTSTPIKSKSDELGIKCFQPDNVNSKDSLAYLKGLSIDLFVVVSFGQILSKALLDIPRLYPLNVHASLLPKYRGAAPINWALANDEKETGITIIKMNEKMDEGEVLLKEAVSIAAGDDAITLSEKLSKCGVRLLLKSIDMVKEKKANFIKQNSKEATYAPKLKKEDGLIDWTKDADTICNRIRAFVPWPVCFTHLNKKILKIWKAYPEKSASGSKPGTILEAGKEGILVATGKDVIRIKVLQLEAKRRMNAEEFTLGHKIGNCFEG